MDAEVVADTLRHSLTISDNIKRQKQQQKPTTSTSTSSSTIPSHSSRPWINKTFPKLRSVRSSAAIHPLTTKSSSNDTLRGNWTQPPLSTPNVIFPTAAPAINLDVKSFQRRGSGAYEIARRRCGAEKLRPQASAPDLKVRLNGSSVAAIRFLKSTDLYPLKSTDLYPRRRSSFVAAEGTKNGDDVTRGAKENEDRLWEAAAVPLPISRAASFETPSEIPTKTSSEKAYEISSQKPSEITSAAPPEVPSAIPTDTSSAERSSLSKRDSIGSSLSAAERRYKIVHEVLSTEKTYVEGLQVLDELYRKPLYASLKASQPLVQSKSQIVTLFANISELLPLHRELLRMLTEMIEGNIRQTAMEVRLGDVFRIMGPFMKMYSIYVRNFNAALSTTSSLMTGSPAFAKFLTRQASLPESRGLGFQSYLILPVQRIPRYKLLLEELLKRTSTDDEGWNELHTAFKIVGEVANFVNETIRQHEMFITMLDIQRSLTGLDQPLLVPGRKFVRRGSVMKICRKNHQLREFFLFSDCLIYASPSMLESDSFHFHRRLRLEDCKVVDLPNKLGVENCFQIISTDKSFAVYAPTSKEKIEWLHDLNLAMEELLSAKRTLRVDTIAQHRLRRRATYGHLHISDTTTTAGNRVTSWQSGSSFSGLGSFFSSATAPAPPLSRSSTLVTPSRRHARHRSDISFYSTTTLPAGARLPVVTDYRAPVWIPDDAAARCMRCSVDFGVILRRKHHCRSCGQVVCRACSTKSFLIRTIVTPSDRNFPPLSEAADVDSSDEYVSHDRAARCCDDCWTKLDEAYPEESEAEDALRDDNQDQNAEKFEPSAAGENSTKNVAETDKKVNIRPQSLPIAKRSTAARPALDRTPPTSERAGLTERVKERLEKTPYVPAKRHRGTGEDSNLENGELVVSTEKKQKNDTRVSIDVAEANKAVKENDHRSATVDKNENEDPIAAAGAKDGDSNVEDDALAVQESEIVTAPRLSPETFARASASTLRRLRPTSIYYDYAVEFGAGWFTSAKRKSPVGELEDTQVKKMRASITDARSSDCGLCKASFGLFRWRRECRRCRRIICSDCISRRRRTSVTPTTTIDVRSLGPPLTQTSNRGRRSSITCDPCWKGVDPAEVRVDERGGGWYVVEPVD